MSAETNLFYKIPKKFPTNDNYYLISHDELEPDLREILSNNLSKYSLKTIHYVKNKILEKQHLEYKKVMQKFFGKCPKKQYVFNVLINPDDMFQIVQEGFSCDTGFNISEGHLLGSPEHGIHICKDLNLEITQKIKNSKLNEFYCIVAEMFYFQLSFSNPGIINKKIYHDIFNDAIVSNKKSSKKSHYTEFLNSIIYKYDIDLETLEPHNKIKSVLPIYILTFESDKRDVLVKSLGLPSVSKNINFPTKENENNENNSCKVNKKKRKIIDMDSQFKVFKLIENGVLTTIKIHLSDLET